MNLIYTVAFGNPEHFYLCREWVKSIRDHGYKESLVILSDKPFEVEGCRTIVCDWMEPSKLWKAAIRRAVNCSDYGKILFLDTDIPHLKNPDLFFSLEGIQIPHEPITVIESGLNSTFLSSEEKTKYGKMPSYNAGTILVPGSDADAFFTTWENEWRKIDYSTEKDHWPLTLVYKGQMYDQGILQAAIIRGKFPKMPVPMEPFYIGFPALPGSGEEKCVALHLCGLNHTDENKRFVLDSMVKLRDANNVAEVSEALKYKHNSTRALTRTMTRLAVNVNERLEYLEEKYAEAMEMIKELSQKIEVLSDPLEGKFETMEQGV